MIEFQNVTFTYQSTERESGVYDLNLTIPDGQIVLLCGESGCGKTTLTRLINGLTPEYYEGKLDGIVLVNGKETTKTPLYELSKVVGSVFQNPRSQFFNVDTTGEIAFGCENIGLPKEEIYRRIGQVTGELRIQKLLDRSLFALSGGEKQRVSIARVILKNPRLLILDEATSALDSISESVIQDAIDPLLKGRTSLVIAHRLSTIMAADEILVVDQGQIVQRGTHQELVEENGVYRELYETQFRRALEDHKNRK